MLIFFRFRTPAGLVWQVVLGVLGVLWVLGVLQALGVLRELLLLQALPQLW